MSNFLGDSWSEKRLTYILSTSELIAREGVELHKSMNYRDGDQLSVFLVLPSHEGTYREAWDPSTETYFFEGHDSTTRETQGKSKDQLLMYGGGRLTDNGKFYKAAKATHEGSREPHQIQVYEKLTAGAWFDKGIFNLIDVREIEHEGGSVYQFLLRPADYGREDRDLEYFEERMRPILDKRVVWERDGGRCARCGSEAGLRFVAGDDVRLICAHDRGEVGGFLG